MPAAPRREIRFAVGRRAGPRSTIWKCWIQGDEVYLTSRMFGSDSKVSLHSSGECQWSCTSSWVLRQAVPRNADRHIVKWQVEYPSTSQALLVFRVGVPASELRPLPPPTDKKKVLWVGNVPAEATVQFLFFVTMPVADAPEVSSLPERHHLISMHLASGRWLVIFAEITSLNAADVRAARDHVVQQVREAGEEVHPEYRFALFGHSNENGSRSLLEVCATDA